MDSNPETSALERWVDSTSAKGMAAEFRASRRRFSAMKLNVSDILSITANCGVGISSVGILGK